jgi:hypothetical protein
MTSGKNVTATQPIEIDPNFFLPPNVVDMRYINLEDAGDSATTRDDDGDIVPVNYDNSDYYGSEEESAEAGTGAVSPFISPPDTVVVVSQQARVTSDGRTVIDVTLDVQDVPGAVNYDVRLTKP